MNRRTFLRAAPTAVALGAAFAPAGPARAVDPATALAVAQFVIGIARMMNPGPGIGDLLRQQAEMLRSIAAQIAAVQAQLNEVLDRLDEIRDALDEVPNNTAIAICKTQIGGAALRYVEWSRVIAAETTEAGIEAARRNGVPRLWSRVVDPVYMARTDLMSTYQRFSVVPAVAMALRVEMDALAWADDSKDEMTVRLDSYADWLKNVVEGPGADKLTGALDLARAERDKLVGSLGPPFDIECYTKSFYRPPLGNTTDYLMRTLFLDSGSAGRSTFADARLEQAVQEMTQAGLFNASDRPMQAAFASPRPQAWTGEVAIGFGWSGEPIERFNSLGKSRDWLLRLPACQPEDLGKRAATESAVAALNLKEMDLMTLRGWKAVADECFGFIARRREAIKAI